MLRKNAYTIYCLLFCLSAGYAQLNWEKTAFPGASATEHAIAVSPTGHVVATGDRGTYLSLDKGKSWQQILPRLAYPPLSMARNSAGVIFVGTLNDRGPTESRMLRSTDNGKTWAETGLPRDYYNVVALDGDDRIIAAASQVGLFQSTNNGVDWSPLWSTSGKYIQTIAVDEYGSLFADSWHSNDDGRSWGPSAGLVPLFDLIPQGAYPYAYDPYVADIDAHARGQVYALVDAVGPDNYVHGGIVLRTTDRGQFWKKVVHFSDKRITCLAVARSGDLFIGTAPGGVLHSTDSGQSWTTTGLEPDVYSIAISPTGVIYAGTHNGVWSAQMPEGVTSTMTTEVQPPDVFALQQNYPNPFNPSTVVSSQLPIASEVKLVVYNLLGQEVAVLVNERRAAGTYRDLFDGSGLASGAYFYRMTAGSFVDTKTFTLVK